MILPEITERLSRLLKLDRSSFLRDEVVAIERSPDDSIKDGGSNEPARYRRERK